MKTVRMAATLVVAGLAGCASVSVRKVPTPTQYVRWTDEMQEKADSLEGFRFYLPRPFVSVFESFPVRTDIFLAHGQLSPDGQHVLIRQVTRESGLGRYVASAENEIEVPTSVVHARNTPSPQSKEILDKFGDLSKKVKPNTIPVGASGDGPKPTAAKAAPKPTGINKRRTTNNNGAFAYQPLRGNFDLVYLPDFEEQFVVESEAGLGNAEFELNLGQGWSLQGFNSITDNSELTKRIYDLLDTAVEAGKAAATYGLDALAPGLGTGLSLLAPQSRTLKKDDLGTSGTPVTLKIVVVHYAAKGIYPIIKPRELQFRKKSQYDSGSRVADLWSHKESRLVGVSEISDQTLEQSAKQVDNLTGEFTVPRYPYQYLSLNTFRYMMIEVVKNADPFRHLYDKTGTAGDPGDRQAADLAAELRALLAANGSRSVTGNKQNLRAWRAALKGARVPHAGGNFEITNVKPNGLAQIVTLKTSGTITSKIARTSLEQKVKALVDAKAASFSGVPKVNPIALRLKPDAIEKVTGEKAKLESTATGLKVVSGNTPVSDFFGVSAATFSTTTGDLALTVTTNGTLQRRYNLTELEDAFLSKFPPEYEDSIRSVSISNAAALASHLN